MEQLWQAFRASEPVTTLDGVFGSSIDCDKAALQCVLQHPGAFVGPDLDRYVAEVKRVLKLQPDRT